MAAWRPQALAPGSAATFTLPYADYPWEQSLKVDAHKLFDIVQQGRILNVAARTASDSFTSQLEKLAADSRRVAEANIYKKFDGAFAAKDVS